MRRCFYIFMVIFLSGTLYAAEDPKLTPEQLSRLPLIVRGDAQEFYQAIYPLLNKSEEAYQRRTLKNPYELFLEAVVFGKTFGAMLDSHAVDSLLDDALEGLVTEKEAASDRKYFREVSGSKRGGSTRAFPRDHVEKLKRWCQDFNRQFGDKVDELIVANNSYAFFVKGFMGYETGTVTGDDALKKEAERHMRCAADYYCKPALNFLEWLYAASKQSNEHAIVKRKISHYQTADMKSGQVSEVVSHAIEHKIFSDSLSSLNIDEAKTFQTNPLQKLIESAFVTAGFDQAFYRGALKHLSKTTGSMRRAAFMTTTSKAWKLSALVAPLVTVSTSSYQIWYAASTNVPQPTNSTAVLNATAANASLVNQTTTSYPSASDVALMETLVMINRTAIASLCSSFANFAYNSWVWYNAPRLVKMDETDLEKECRLTALYLAASHKPTDVDEDLAEKVINVWFKDSGSFWACCRGKQPTLSQLALKP